MPGVGAADCSRTCFIRALTTGWPSISRPIQIRWRSKGVQPRPGRRQPRQPKPATPSRLEFGPCRGDPAGSSQRVPTSRP